MPRPIKGNSPRQPVNISVERDLIKKVKANGLNLSDMVNDLLREWVEELEEVNEAFGIANDADDSFRCACCDLMRHKSRGFEQVKFDRVHAFYLVCPSCHTKIKKSGYKTIQGYLNSIGQ